MAAELWTPPLPHRRATEAAWTIGRATGSASIYENQLNAIILNGEDIWAVQPVTDVDARADHALHAVYRKVDLNLPSWACVGVPNPEGPGIVEPAADTGHRRCNAVAEIAVDMDHEEFVFNGSNVNAAMAEIEAIINGINVIYETDVNITQVISDVILRTDPERRVHRHRSGRFARSVPQPVEQRKRLNPS